eukprot:CAMPEP_0114583600 /NCGR_PEP_ID=MMETSP0125-20121206/7286_1 /TAXON_ID=485358 ORGANISM="Aristerostoma sp., Strain ATCC 50986" /NCGR_SAMPLE_ID=MMETSP0125 /ASSEMBLY_ACC=CAM_ASM_000245 /LENGTH=65 /DNA_ID=CAMNT_0001777125 /DNA_START=2686 /DNA_END=2883 /DNA_ORIENTATION=-
MVGEKNEPTTNNSTSHSNLSTKFGEVKKQGYIWDFNLNNVNLEKTDQRINILRDMMTSIKNPYGD